MKSSKDKLSVFLSLVLRHKPEVIGLTLDKEGYIEVDKLIEGFNNSGRFFNFEMLEKIVREDNKGRYSFNSDKTKIRANQGHSIKVDVGLVEKKPPMYLYHGTSIGSVDSIKSDGIRKMTRLHVHLSKDYATAIDVGKRRGKCVVLKVMARKMYDEGYKFYLSENGVWLTNHVDKRYIVD